MKRILVALDASERAPAVLAAAVRLAEVMDAKLVLYRAINLPTEVPAEAYLATDVRLEDVLKRNAHEALSRMASTIPAALVEALAVELAIPWDGILRTSHQRDADLIVIGSHGFRGLDRLLGTTAAKVVNRADRNVLVVRTPL